MILALQSFSARPRYGIASILLLLAIFGSVFTVRLLDAPDWAGGLIGLPLALLLTVITYFRLRDAALSGSWIWLMIISFNMGPEWNGLYLGNLINLVPILMAWTVPAGSGANPQPTQIRS